MKSHTQNTSTRVKETVLEVWLGYISQGNVAGDWRAHKTKENELRTLLKKQFKGRVCCFSRHQCNPSPSKNREGGGPCCRAFSGVLFRLPRPIVKTKTMNRNIMTIVTMAVLLRDEELRAGKLNACWTFE